MKSGNARADELAGTVSPDLGMKPIDVGAERVAVDHDGGLPPPLSALERRRPLSASAATE